MCEKIYPLTKEQMDMEDDWTLEALDRALEKREHEQQEKQQEE